MGSRTERLQMFAKTKSERLANEFSKGAAVAFIIVAAIGFVEAIFYVDLWRNVDNNSTDISGDPNDNPQTTKDDLDERQWIYIFMIIVVVLMGLALIVAAFAIYYAWNKHRKIV